MPPVTIRGWYLFPQIDKVIDGCFGVWGEGAMVTFSPPSVYSLGT